MGPDNEVSEWTHAEKYRGNGEDFREAMGRIANGLKDDDEHFKRFRDALLNMRFLPAGRIQAAVGSTRRITPYNCFVSGAIDDSFVDGNRSIMARATQAAQTMRHGGGIGYDFSTLRPSGALIKKLGSFSSGPVSFMTIYDAVCGCVASAGHRRGAQMGVLRVDHPDIEKFIHAKQNDHRLTGFNISVGITDEFMRAVEQGRQFTLRFENQEYSQVDARALWETIMRSTWDWAEPGVLFLDTINRMNNLRYCEYIAATNPCGEQPLPPHGACLLGSFNLVKYIVESGSERGIDYFRLTEDAHDVVRAMDNVVDRAIYPLREQEVEAHSKRRMGLGVTGVANALEACGRPYGSPEFCDMLKEVLTVLRDACYRASVDLAKEKGAFRLFQRDAYLEGEFIKTLPEDIRDGIAAHGIRNSHLLSIAPTGTISLCANNVSSGIEPVFALHQERDLILAEGPKTVQIEDFGYKYLGVEGKVSSEVTIDEHLAVLSTAQSLVDSAVSKTCNVSPTMPWADFGRVYQEAWRLGCKGITTFNPGGKRFGILREAGKPPEEACRVDPETGQRFCE